MHVVWLASWYPHERDPFNGDFIQRHARALGTRQPVTVIHVAKGSGRLTGTPDLIRSSEGNLTEWIGFVKPSKLTGQIRSFQLYQRALKAHIAEHGKPALIHVHVCMSAGIAALWAKWRYNIPFVVTEHYSSYIPGSPGEIGKRSFLYRFLNRLILEQAEGVHSVSHFLIGYMSQFAVLKQTVVIPNAVDTRLFSAAEPLPRPMRFRFVHVSTYLPHKNVPQMLAAFAQLQQKRADWELALVGPAPNELQVSEIAQTLADRLIWSGELSYEGVSKALKEANALVLFSYVENQPCVISEALCTGLPVVASDVGGVSEVLNKENGMIVSQRNIDELAQALDQIIDDYAAYDPANIARQASESHAYSSVGIQFQAFYARFDKNFRKHT